MPEIGIKNVQKKTTNKQRKTTRATSVSHSRETDLSIFTGLETYVNQEGKRFNKKYLAAKFITIRQ